MQSSRRTIVFHYNSLRSRAAELFVVVLCASFLNTFHEILELCFDLWMGFPCTIGPGVFDTNFDLLSSTLGMV